jgi:biopolymer transport protein ExbB
LPPKWNKIMHVSESDRRALWPRVALYLVCGLISLAVFWSLPARRDARGQEKAAPEEVAGPSSEPASVPAPATTAPAAARQKDQSINIWQLAMAGGIFMIPIAGMSILAVTMTIERLLALRTERVLPSRLVAGLSELSAGTGKFDPKKAYRLCQQFPSAAASVIRVMLLKVGRPLTEIEGAVAQASQREADRLYANVRWLNAAASLSTMLGLIGTIQGMILAFHRLTVMDAAADRTTVLADGIYTALVTTFAGLAVAIPSLLASHFLEGRILKLFHQIDELVLQLLPQLERYEGRVRFGRSDGNGEMVVSHEPAQVATEGH